MGIFFHGSGFFADPDPDLGKKKSDPIRKKTRIRNTEYMKNKS